MCPAKAIFFNLSAISRYLILSIMKKLERQEMKNLKGGMNAPPGGYTMAQAGYEIHGSNCLCDYYHQFADGSNYWRCHEPCPMTCCSPSYSCSLYID